MSGSLRWDGMGGGCVGKGWRDWVVAETRTNFIPAPVTAWETIPGNRYRSLFHP